MSEFLLRGRIRDGMKASLAAKLKDDTLAAGEPYQDALLSALHEGYASGDEAWLTVDVPEEQLEPVERALDGYFTLLEVRPVDDVPGDRLEALKGLDALPEWAGVDR